MVVGVGLTDFGLCHWHVLCTVSKSIGNDSQLLSDENKGIKFVALRCLSEEGSILYDEDELKTDE